jgi:hypothetical protein
MLLFGATALERVHGFHLGDSTYEWKKKKWDGFTEKLLKVAFSFSYVLMCNVVTLARFYFT